MIELRQIEKPEDASERARTGFGRPEDDALQAGVPHRTRTHGTGFERHVERRLGKAVVAEHARRLADRENFGVGRRIARSERTVVGARDDFAVHRHDRADGDFFERPRLFGFPKGLPHEAAVLLFVNAHARTVHGPVFLLQGRANGRAPPRKDFAGACELVQQTLARQLRGTFDPVAKRLTLVLENTAIQGRVQKRFGVRREPVALFREKAFGLGEKGVPRSVRARRREKRGAKNDPQVFGIGKEPVERQSPPKAQFVEALEVRDGKRGRKRQLIHVEQKLVTTRRNAPFYRARGA